MRSTRKLANDCDQSGESVEIGASLKAPPLSDPSYERKFVIAKENALAGSSLYQVRHPKNGSPCIYRIGEKYCDEVMSVGESFRSWFYGDSVVSDGTIRLMSPVHPLFLALPYFIKSKDVFTELDQILTDSQCPSIAVLLKNEQFLSKVDAICDMKEVLGATVFRFSEAKALEWISGRFHRLRDALRSLKDCLHKSIINDENVLNRYAFGILSDYMNTEIATLAKAHLCIQDSTDDSGHVDMSMKRKADAIHEDIHQKPVKKLKESVAMKKLQQASKGTKSIGSFFSRKV